MRQVRLPREDRDRLFGRDWVHLSRVGHEVVAEAVQEAIGASWR